MINVYYHIILNIIGVGLYCYDLEKRKYFWLRLLAALVVYVGYNVFILKIILTAGVGRWFNYFSLAINFSMLFSAVLFCFDVKPVAAFFCATCGYCIQHLSQRASELVIVYWLKLRFQSAPAMVARVVVALLVVFVFGLFYKKFINRNGVEPRTDDKAQLALTGCFLAVSLFIEQWIQPYLMSADRILRIGIDCISFLYASIIICLEYYLVTDKSVKEENSILKRIMETERRQYETEKSIIDMVNIKCHDLKHYLVDGRLPDEEKNNVSRVVSIYDSFYKTGNETLNTVLTTKGFVCENKKIRFHCEVDGESISFMSNSDIYSLFGNLLDNCIEATEVLPEQDRIVDIVVKRKENFVFIKTKNNFDGVNVMHNGVIVTKKQDKVYHGWGLKSIKSIVQKYNGDISITSEDNVFKTSIIFCL